MGVVTAVASKARRRGLGSLVDAIHEVRQPYLVRREHQDLRQLAHLLPFLLRRDSNCVDVGANIGTVLTLFEQAAPAGSHIAFEPLPQLAADLRHRFPRAAVHETALSDQAGEAEFLHVTELPAMSGLKSQEYPRPVSSQSLKVTVSTLSDALPRGYVPSLVKIDVEGAECDVIAGGLEVLALHKPLLVIEHYAGAGAEYDCNPDRLHELITQLGMEILDIDGRGPYEAWDLRRAYEAREIWTFVARPA